MLANGEVPFEWTEKIDGQNISVEWTGYEVLFHGRTEKAELPKELLDYLEEKFKGNTAEQVFEQVFGDKRVILYGEGYGGKIQGGVYDGSERFVLFDIYFPDSDIWADSMTMVGIANSFDIDTVPIIFISTVEEAIEFVKSYTDERYFEGLVGKPIVELRNRGSERIILKVKVKDFQ